MNLEKDYINFVKKASRKSKMKRRRNGNLKIKMFFVGNKKC
jgi:hypothetical protein